MTHLSNTNKVMLMVAYSGITFFIGPLVTRPLLKDHPEQCVAGFLLGVTICSIHWMKYGRKL